MADKGIPRTPSLPDYKGKDRDVAAWSKALKSALFYEFLSLWSRTETLDDAMEIFSGVIETNHLAANCVTSEKVTTGELITVTAQIKNAIISSAKLVNYAAGDVLIAAASTERTTQNLNYILVKEIYVARAGTLRIKFDERIQGADPSDGAYGIIRRYRGTTESDVGTERYTESTTYVTFSEDIADWEIGDKCRLYYKREATGTAYVRNFAIYSTSTFAEVTLMD